MDISLIQKKKNIICAVVFVFLLFFPNSSFADAEIFTQKQLDDAAKQAFALYNTNDDKGALKILENIPRAYQNENMLLVMANIYEDKGNYDKAIELMNRIITINPKSYKAYYNLGCVFLKRKEYEQAKENFKISIRLNPDYAYSYYNLGCVYYHTGDYKNAKRNFIKSLNLEPQNDDCRYNLGMTYKALGDKKSATKIFAKLK